MSNEYPARIRATDLGEFYTASEDFEMDDTLLLCCTENGEEGSLQPDTPAFALMEEMARRYNTQPELLAAIEWIAASDHPEHPEFGEKSEARPSSEAEFVGRLRSRAQEALSAIKRLT